MDFTWLFPQVFLQLFRFTGFKGPDVRHLSFKKSKVLKVIFWNTDVLQMCPPGNYFIESYYPGISILQHKPILWKLYVLQVHSYNIIFIIKYVFIYKQTWIIKYVSFWEIFIDPPQLYYFWVRTANVPNEI